jgi:predicted dehydrogenase
MADLTRRGFLEANAATAIAAGQNPRSANDRIQVAFVGCGARAHELMAGLLAHPQADIVSVCDAYKGRTERAIDRIQGLRGKAPRVVNDWRDSVQDPAIDAVVIASPDHWHKTMCLEALARGKDVYCEKPLTYRSADGLEIIEAARARKRIVQVGSQGMSTQVQAKARELIQAGRIGKVTMVRAAYNRNTASGAWIYPIPPDANPQTVNWEQFLGPAPKRPFSLERFFRWRCYEDYSGGIATDLFVHLCTTIHYLMGATAPARVVALGELYRWKESRDVPDTLNAILEYPEGFTVNLSSTFNNQAEAEGSFAFLGTEGTLQLGSGRLRHSPETARDDNRWIVESWPKALENKYYQDPKVIASEIPAAARPSLSSRGADYEETGQDSTVTHFGHFLASVRSRTPYWEDAVRGHQAAACAHMVNLSAKSHRVVEWDFSRNDIKA